MDKKPQPTSRETLYEEIWSEPVTALAPRYGLSDVGLLKACRRLHIPVPGRGYWAKIKAGQVTIRPPLLPWPVGSYKPPGPTRLSEQEIDTRAKIHDALEAVEQALPTITVPATLIDPHPLIRNASLRLNRRDGWSDPSGARRAPKEVLDIQTTPGCLDRALRFMDTLLKVLEQQGMKVHIDSNKGETVLVGRGTAVSISLIETIARKPHSPTPKEARARDRYFDSFRTGAVLKDPAIPQFDWHPTGRLTLTVGRWPSRKWNDTERSRLDSRIRSIVSETLALLEEIAAKEAAEARRQALYREAVSVYESQVRQRAEERARLRQTLRDAARLRKAQHLREYIAAVAEKARKDGRLSPETETWIAWANGKADWIDPLIAHHDPILDAPEPIEPNFWKM